MISSSQPPPQMTAYEFAARSAIKGHGGEPTPELMARVMWTLEVMIKCGYSVAEAAATAAETHLLAS